MPKKHYYYHSTKLTKTANKAFTKKATKGQQRRNNRNKFFRKIKGEMNKYSEITFDNFEKECQDADDDTKDIIFRLLKMKISSENSEEKTNTTIIQKIRNFTNYISNLHNRVMRIGYSNNKKIINIKCKCNDDPKENYQLFKKCDVSIMYDVYQKKVYYNGAHHLPLEQEILSIEVLQKTRITENEFTPSEADINDIKAMINGVQDPSQEKTKGRREKASGSDDSTK